MTKRSGILKAAFAAAHAAPNSARDRARIDAKVDADAQRRAADWLKTSQRHSRIATTRQHARRGR